MPSGITADIYEGKDVTLRDYLMRVGRQMGYAILQRDSDLDEPVKPSQPSSYYEQQIAECSLRLEELRALRGERLVAAARADFEERHRAWEDSCRRDAELHARYEDMLAQVEAWEPDPLIASTKDYAIKYLRESIEFDCGMRHYPEPTKQPPGVWLEERIASAEESLERTKRHHAEECERTAERNQHIEAFLRSLPRMGVAA